jgi:hypothetical protein
VPRVGGGALARHGARLAEVRSEGIESEWVSVWWHKQVR